MNPNVFCICWSTGNKNGALLESSPPRGSHLQQAITRVFLVFQDTLISPQHLG
jgi:hypothetical protein